MAPRSRNTKTRTKADIDKETPSNPLIQIPEEEQQRLIQESGVLNKITRGGQNDQTNTSTPEETATPFFDEFFNTLFLLVPFSFLLLLMELWVSILANSQPWIF
jgi:hypothetical protein